MSRMSRFGGFKVAVGNSGKDSTKNTNANYSTPTPTQVNFNAKKVDNMISTMSMTKENFQLVIDPTDIAKVKEYIKTTGSISSQKFFEQIKKMLDNGVIPYTVASNIILNEFRSNFFDCVDPTGEASNPVNVAVLSAAEEYLFKDMKSFIYSYIDQYVKSNMDSMSDFADAIFRITNNAISTLGYAGKFDFTTLLCMIWACTKTFETK